MTSLRQEELDSIHRQNFIDQILPAVRSGETVRFLAVKNHHSLITIRQKITGTYEFSIASEYRFTYKMSDLLDFIERLYNSGANIIPLRGELQIECTRVRANADAEPDHIPEASWAWKAN